VIFAHSGLTAQLIKSTRLCELQPRTALTSTTSFDSGDLAAGETALPESEPNAQKPAIFAFKNREIVKNHPVATKGTCEKVETKVDTFDPR
jgi:hypothetical protein